MNPVKAKRDMTADELSARPKKGTGSRTTTVEYDDYSQLDSIALNYIKEKVREYKLGRSINNNAKTSALVWGKVIEMYVFQDKSKMPLRFRDGNLIGRLTHHEVERWTGIPDFLEGEPSKNSIVSDLKCQSSLIRFCDLHDNTVDLQTFKENHKEYYWQLVSNAILTFSDKAKFMWYVPYASELPKILEFVQSIDENSLPSDLSIWQVKRISDDILDFMDTGRQPAFAYLPDNSEYSDLTTFEFEISQEDKDLLTSRVKMAVKELEKQLKA